MFALSLLSVTFLNLSLRKVALTMKNTNTPLEKNAKTDYDAHCTVGVVIAFAFFRRGGLGFRRTSRRASNAGGLSLVRYVDAVLSYENERSLGSISTHFAWRGVPLLRFVKLRARTSRRTSNAENLSLMQCFVTRARASTEPQDNLNASRLAEGTISAIFEVPSKNLKSNLKR